MFRRQKRVTNGDKPADERKIELDAYLALRKSRKEISRASDILESEVRRIDDILLSRGKNA